MDNFIFVLTKIRARFVNELLFLENDLRLTYMSILKRQFHNHYF